MKTRYIAMAIVGDELLSAAKFPAIILPNMPSTCESDTAKKHFGERGGKRLVADTPFEGVTAQVLSKADGPSVERLSVGTANSSLLSMLRGLRTNTCRDVTGWLASQLVALRASSIAMGG